MISVVEVPPSRPPNTDYVTQKPLKLSYRRVLSSVFVSLQNCVFPFEPGWPSRLSSFFAFSSLFALFAGVACINQKYSKESIFTLTMPKINKRRIVSGCEGGGYYYCPRQVSVCGAYSGLTLIDGTALHHRKASRIILKLFDEEPT